MKFKCHNISKGFWIFFGIFFLVIIIGFIYFTVISKNNYITGIIFFSLGALLAFTYPFFYWFETKEDYILVNFYHIPSKVKYFYNNITYVGHSFLNPWTTIFILNHWAIYFEPRFENQEKLIEIILEKNPNCRISRKIGEQMQKKLGKSFDAFVMDRKKARVKKI